MMARALRLRVIQRLVLAIVTVLAFSGVAGPGHETRSVLFDTVGVVGKGVDRGATPETARRRPTRTWQDGATHRAADLKAIEESDVNDKDPLGDVPFHAALAFEIDLTPGAGGSHLRAELLHDTSQFATGIGLPRGPPAI